MFQIIPAIDLIDGKCVRLTQGDYSQKKIYNEDPLEVAQEFEDAGIQRLHLVDLDGAKQKQIVNGRVLERIASKTNLQIDFGGGVQSDEAIRMAFEYGAHQVTGGSVAVKNPELMHRWLETYGGEKIILGADFKEGKIAVSGWEEKSELDVFNFIAEYQEKGARYVISTDVSKDGLLQGPATAFYEDFSSKFPAIHCIASGGVSNFADIEALAALPLYGVIVGKAIYEGRISLMQIHKFMSA